MSFLMILFWFFLAYIAFKVIFNFIIPIYRTTRQVKRSFRNMQEQMNQTMNQQQYGEQQPNPSSQKKQPQTSAGEYIDFEEVKD